MCSKDFRARYYDPAIDRFISEDPIGLAGGTNEYAYAYDDPIDFGDPFGLKPPSPPPPCGGLGVNCSPNPPNPNNPCQPSSNANRVAKGLEGVANLADDSLRVRGWIAGTAALSETPPAAAVFAVYGGVSIIGQGLAGVSQIAESVTGNMNGAAHQFEQFGNVLAAPASGLTTLVITKGNLSEAENASAYEGLVNGGVGLVDKTVPLLQRLTEFGMNGLGFLPDCSQ